MTVNKVDGEYDEWERTDVADASAWLYLVFPVLPLETTGLRMGFSVVDALACFKLVMSEK